MALREGGRASKVGLAWNIGDLRCDVRLAVLGGSCRGCGGDKACAAAGAVDWGVGARGGGIIIIP